MNSDLIHLDKSAFIQSGAIFCFGKQVHLFWGEPKTFAQPPSGTSLYYNDFFLNSIRPWHQWPNHLKVPQEQWLEGLGSPRPQSLSWLKPLKEDYHHIFSWVQSLIENQQVNKVVPYLFETSSCRFQDLDLWSRLSQASQFPGSLYGFWNQQEVVMGVTPEILFQTEAAGVYKTMALAGTRDLQTYLENPESFLNDTKERAEHQWVVDGLCEDLRPWAKVTLGGTQVLTTTHLAHLYTPIEFRPFKKMTPSQLIQGLHPTAALGVSPREQTWPVMEFLEKKLPRAAFGAPFALMEEGGEICALVGIRQWQWSQGQLRIGAGGGVVQESIEDQEWQELQKKREGIKRMFAWQ